MRMLVRVATVAALSAVVAAPASAQFWRGDIGINGGGTWWSNLMSSGDAVTDLAGNQQNLGQSLHFGDRINWITGAQATLWITNRFGIRANGTYTDAPLRLTDNIVSDNINLWSGSGDLLYRFVRGPHEEWQGFEVLPYVALGAGAKWINPAGHAANCFDTGTTGDSTSCLPFGVNLDGGANGVIALNESTRFMGLVGLGTDLRFARHWSVRVEVDDRIYKPEIFAFERQPNPVPPPPFIGPCTGPVPSDCVNRVDDNLAKTVHEVSLTAGLHYLFGLRRPPVVAIVEPPPAPPPPPPPAPPPPPREDDITVCVVDMSANDGLRMQDAVFLHASGDTVVEQGGQRVPLSQAVPSVPVAQGQDWYVRGTPLVVTSGDYTAEFVTYGQATTRSPDQMALFGTYNGVPIYADADQIAVVSSQLETQGNRELSSILQNTELRDEFDDLRTIYAPLRTTGCVFQPLLRQEPVRKGGKDQ